MIVSLNWLCRVRLHPWGKWSEPYSVNMSRFISSIKVPGSEFAENHQYRLCEACGLRDERKI